MLHTGHPLLRVYESERLCHLLKRVHVSESGLPHFHCSDIHAWDWTHHRALPKKTTPKDRSLNKNSDQFSIISNSFKGSFKYNDTFVTLSYVASTSICSSIALPMILLPSL